MPGTGNCCDIVLPALKDAAAERRIGPTSLLKIIDNVSTDQLARMS